MKLDPNNALVWLDIETTGLNPDRERIIEIAAIITDGNLVEIAASTAWVIHQPEALLAAMDPWCTNQHGKSGLLDRVRSSALTEADVDVRMVAFVGDHVDTSKGKAVLAGSSIHFDRSFIRPQMPSLEALLHYRMVDVSSIKELTKRWYPDAIVARPAELKSHRALDDIRDSINELKHYRERVFA